jgi:tRNA threonylcarbamoyladenosine modification (KEOPS) complex  Pcc1 subunit
MPFLRGAAITSAGGRHLDLPDLRPHRCRRSLRHYHVGLPAGIIRKVEVAVEVTLPRALARPVHVALRPEILHQPRPWTSARLTRQESRITLRISAETTAEVRAALNSYLRLLEAAVGALEVTRPE